MNIKTIIWTVIGIVIAILLVFATGFSEGLEKTIMFIMGGLFIRVIFLNMPDKVFAGWVYSPVNEATRTVTGYEFRSLRLESKESELTKEDILQAVNETPDLKLW